MKKYNIYDTKEDINVEKYGHGFIEVLSKYLSYPTDLLFFTCQYKKSKEKILIVDDRTNLRYQITLLEKDPDPEDEWEAV